MRPDLFESFVSAASGKNAQRAVTLAGAHQLGGSTQGCAGAGTGGDAVIEQHLPCGALGIGRGNRQHGIHYIGVIVFRHKTGPDAGNAVVATPVMVPPLPTPITTASIASPAAFKIWGPVTRR